MSTTSVKLRLWLKSGLLARTFGLMNRDSFRKRSWIDGHLGCMEEFPLLPMHPTELPGTQLDGHSMASSCDLQPMQVKSISKTAGTKKGLNLFQQDPKSLSAGVFARLVCCCGMARYI